MLCVFVHGHAYVFLFSNKEVLAITMKTSGYCKENLRLLKRKPQAERYSQQMK